MMTLDFVSGQTGPERYVVLLGSVVAEHCEMNVGGRLVRAPLVAMDENFSLHRPGEEVLRIVRALRRIYEDVAMELYFIVCM